MDSDPAGCESSSGDAALAALSRGAVADLEACLHQWLDEYGAVKPFTRDSERELLAALRWVPRAPPARAAAVRASDRAGAPPPTPLHADPGRSGEECAGATGGPPLGPLLAWAL